LWIGGHTEQITAEREFLFSVTVTEEAVVADALKALRWDMEQEATDEFRGTEGHCTDAAAVPVILPPEANLTIVY